PAATNSWRRHAWRKHCERRASIWSSWLWLAKANRTGKGLPNGMWRRTARPACLKAPEGRVTRVPNRSRIAGKVRASCNSSLPTQGFLQIETGGRAVLRSLGKQEAQVVQRQALGEAFLAQHVVHQRGFLL